MIEIRLNGEALTLGDDTQASIEYTSGLLNEALDDSFSLPFTVPVRGNERLLSDTHQFGRRNRPLEFKDAEIWRDGTRLHPGILYVEGSNEEEGTITLSLAVEGFISSLDDRTLRELDMGPTVYPKDMPLHAQGRNNQFWPQTPYVFPMVKAKDLYSKDQNPAWTPDTKEWDGVTGSYEVNDLVLFTGGPGIIQREELYQRLTPGGSGGYPHLDPVNWRRTAFGIVNHWNHETGTFFTNSTDGNFYALLPMFFLKEVLKRALAAYDYALDGDWYTDVRYDQLLLWNNFTLDSVAKNFFFRASQTEPFSGQEPVIIPFDDDSTGDNEDTSGLWNTGTYRFAAPLDGDYYFTVRLAATISAMADVRLRIYNETFSTYVATHEFGAFTEIDAVVNFSLSCLAGQEFTFRVTLADGYDPATITVHDCWIIGWATSVSDVNTFAQQITPSDHMPHVTLKSLLLQVRDIFGLRVRADVGTRAVRLDYMDRLVLALPQEDITPTTRGTVALDHSSPLSGFSFGWDLDVDAPPDLSRLSFRGAFARESDFPLPLSAYEYVYALDTRLIFIPKFGKHIFPDELRWTPTTWRMPDVLVGERDSDTRDIVPDLKPLLMDMVWTNGKQLLMPTTDDQGNSPFYRTSDNAPLLRMTYWRGMRYSGEMICDGGFVLAGSSFLAANGVYCPDGTYNGHPRWTRSGGVTMEDSIFWTVIGESLPAWRLTSGGTMEEGLGNIRFYSLTSTDDPSAMIWQSIAGEVPPFHVVMDEAAPVTYPCATSFAYGLSSPAEIWDNELDWTSNRGPLELHQRAMLEALIGAETVTTDLEVTPGMLTGQDYERGRVLKHQKCFILTLPLDHTTKPGRMISEGARILKLKNP